MAGSVWCKFTFAVVFLLVCLLAEHRIYGQSQYGSYFLITVPYSRSADLTGHVDLILTNPGSSHVTVTLTQHDGQGQRDSYVVPSLSFFRVPLLAPLSDYMLPETGVTADRTLELTSTGSEDFGVIMQGTSAYDGYMALPVSEWGKAYTVATFCEGTDSVCQTVILAKEDYTDVTITIPPANQTFRLDEPGTTYADAETLSRILMKYEAWVVQKPYEMTGSFVHSNATVGIVVGAQRTGYRSDWKYRHDSEFRPSSQGAVTEQLPPLTSLGREYVSLGVATVRIVTTEPQTIVHTSNASPVLVQDPGHWIQKVADSSSYIRADKPVLVVEFGVFRFATAYPFFTILTPVLQFLGRGKLTVYPRIQSQIQLLFVVTQNKSREFVSVRNKSLVNVDSFDSQTGHSEYYVDRVVYYEGSFPQVGAGEKGFVQDDGTEKSLTVEMGEEVYGGDGAGLYFGVLSNGGVSLLPLARRFADINPEKNCQTTVAQKAADTIDNDCDGMVDEDDCDSSSGNTGTDCGLPYEEPRDSFGRHFVAVIPDYISLLTVNLALTTLSISPVTVQVNESGITTTNYTLSAPGNPLAVPLNSSSSHTLTTGVRSTHVIHVSSDAAISVTFYASGMLSNRITGGAMKLIPEDALGKAYYVVTVNDPGSNSYFQIVSVFPDTSIDIHLRLETFQPATHQAYVTVNNVSYGNGDVIRTEVMGEYEALQIRCSIGCDLSGTLVASTKPVAVFSISDQVFMNTIHPGSLGIDNFMEQLPPVDSYGQWFIVKQQPARNHIGNYCGIVANCADLVWIVASEDNTIVQVANGDVEELHLRSAGEVLRLVLKAEVMQIESNRAVLVVQVLKTLSKNDGALLVVPPVGQFQNNDVVMFDPSRTSGEMQIVVCGLGELLCVVSANGVHRETYTIHSPVAGPSLFNVSCLEVNFTGGEDVFAELYSPSSGGFGGYVSVLGYGESITSLSHGFGLVNQPCTVTKTERGDGEDNDCDELFDEEPCFIDTLLDADGDGRYNEDCRELPETTTADITTIPEETTPNPTTPKDKTTTTTTTIATNPSRPPNLCGCTCRQQQKVKEDSESLNSVLNSLVQELTVDKKDLSAVKRQKQSAPDDRPSAQTVGYLGVTIIVTLGVGIVCLDAGALYRDLKHLIAACNEP